MNIIDLIQSVGVENVTFQNVLNAAVQIGLTKQGRTKVTFLTNQVTPGDLAGHEKPKNFGLILWMPLELVEKAQADLAASAQVAGAGKGEVRE